MTAAGRAASFVALASLLSCACGTTAYGGWTKPVPAPPGRPCWQPTLGCPAGDLCLAVDVLAYSPDPPFTNSRAVCASVASGCNPENPCGCGPYVTELPPDGGAPDPNLCYGCSLIAPRFDGGSSLVFCVRDLLDGG